MKKFYCNGKKGICDLEACPDDCEFRNDKGGAYVEVEEAVLTPPKKNTMKVVLDPGAIMPTRAHELDAGLDLYSPVDDVVYHDDCLTIDTGVHVEIPAGYVGMIKSKSGLNVKHGILSEGVIDAGYTGSICVKLYNHGNCAVPIQKGQKISQLVLLPIITPDLELVDSLEATERGEGGFGSTGAF